MPGGRPTKYKEEYCEMLVKHMAQGYSFESFAPIAGVWKDALYQWAKKYPEFSDAKKRATDQCRLFWERLGVAGTVGLNEIKDSQGNVIKLKAFNAAMWIFNMKNRFGWCDRPIEDESESEKYETPKTMRKNESAS